MRIRRVDLIVLMAFASVMVLVPWARAQTPATKKFATPAEVIKAAEAAHDRGDVAASIDCLSSEGQAEGVNLLLMLASMMDAGPAPADADAKKGREELQALFARHGLKDRARKEGEADEAYLQRMAGKVTGRREFLIAAMNLTNPPEKPVRPCIKGELRELKITGDTATAAYAVTQADKSVMSQSVKFKKEDGSWRLAGLLGVIQTERDQGAAKARPATRP